MASTFLATMSLVITLMMSASSATIATAFPQAVTSDIATTAQEMQRAHYFTFVMLVRMVQEKIPRNTTFLMPSDRLLSTASISESQVLEFLSRHSVSAPLMFNDLIRLPNGTVLPTRHLGDTITVTNIKHQKIYFNGIELTSPDLCHLGESFRCHGINGVIRPTATCRVKAATCTHYATPTSAAPEKTLTENQSFSTSSLPPPNGSSTNPAHEPAAESPQSSDTFMSTTGLVSTTLVIALMFSIL